MSHITTQKVKIANARKEILENGLKLMLKNISDLSMVDHIIDWNGNKTPIDTGCWGIKHKSSRYGQQIQIRNGEIIFKGESMDYKTKEYLTNQLKQFYNAQATLVSMAQMGYTAQMQYNKGKVRIVGMG